MASKILVTGSNGLIGSAVCLFFAHRGFPVHGLRECCKRYWSPARNIPLDGGGFRSAPLALAARGELFLVVARKPSHT